MTEIDGLTKQVVEQSNRPEKKLGHLEYHTKSKRESEFEKKHLPFKKIKKNFDTYMCIRVKVHLFTVKTDSIFKDYVDR